MATRARRTPPDSNMADSWFRLDGSLPAIDAVGILARGSPIAKTGQAVAGPRTAGVSTFVAGAAAPAPGHGAGPTGSSRTHLTGESLAARNSHHSLDCSA